MPERININELPRGLARMAFRAPVWLYRLRMGWLLGHRFLLLTHTGRKSGLPHQTVLEIVRYDNTSGICIVASGWGRRSDWFQNIIADPKITIQVQNKRSEAIAELLSPQVGAQELLDYSRLHPAAFRELAKFMGYRLEGTEDEFRLLGQEIPMFALKPVLKPEHQLNNR